MVADVLVMNTLAMDILVKGHFDKKTTKWIHVFFKRVLLNKKFAADSN